MHCSILLYCEKLVFTSRLVRASFDQKISHPSQPMTAMLGQGVRTISTSEIDYVAGVVLLSTVQILPSYVS